MHHRTFRLLALLAALALLLGACGDDDSAATDRGSSQGDRATSDGGSSEDGAEDETEDAAQDAIGDRAGGECGFLGEFATTGLEGALDEADPFTDGGDAFNTLAEEFEEVADAAPDEIKDAFATLAEGMVALADALGDVDLADPESFDPSVFEEIDQEKYQRAGDEVEAWLEEHCPGIGG